MGRARSARIARGAAAMRGGRSGGSAFSAAGGGRAGT